jgi:transglutaminase-like putative cysteine protease
MAVELERYLRASDLCDFDTCATIGEKAHQLAGGCRHPGEAFETVFSFVKEMPYGLEDWDVKASETLMKGWGMCSGKTNLLVALVRSLGIHARYRVFRISTEAELWSSIISDERMADRLGSAPAQQDHVDCEVWLDEWRQADPARDTALERVMEAMGIPLERKLILDDLGQAHVLLLASVDEWARERQARRRFRKNRDETFAWVNAQFERMRELGRQVT